MARGLLMIAGTAQQYIPLPVALSLAVPRNPELSMVSDVDGRLIVAYLDAAFELDSDGASWVRLPIPLSGQQITGLFIDRRNMLWVGTAAGLFGWRRGSYSDQPVRGPDGHIESVLEDREGNLWVAARDGGIVRLPPDLTVSYPTNDVVAPGRPVHVVEDRMGRIHAFSWFGIPLRSIAAPSRRCRPRSRRSATASTVG
jgi:ligand-binding sensor domain-containing protein